MLKRKFTKALILGLGLTIASSGTVFANEVSTQIAPDTPVSNVAEPAPQISKEITQLQIEIDRYLFIQHSEDIAKKGFKVTHTVPTENYVEIGIEPYSEESAEYLYSLFGKDKIKVVEGEQAILYDLAVSSGAGVSPGYAPEAPVGEPAGISAANMEIDPAVQEIDMAEEMVLFSAQDSGAESAEADSASAKGMYYAVAGVAVLGLGALGTRKLLSQKKK